MALSNLYTTNNKAVGVSGKTLCYVLTKTLHELFPEAGTAFDASILMCNGSTSTYMSKGGYGLDGFTLKNNNGVIQTGSDEIDIVYLGSAILYDPDSVLNTRNTVINLSQCRAVNDINNTLWASLSNVRFIIDICDYDIITPHISTTIQDIDYSLIKNNCRGFGGAYCALTLIYANTNTPYDYRDIVSGTDYEVLTGDNAKRCIYLSNTYQVEFTNYKPSMTDSTALEKITAPPAYFFNIGGDIIMVRDACTAPNSVDWGDFDVIDGNYLSIGGAGNGDATSKIAQNDDTWCLYGYEGWGGGVWRRTWHTYYKTALCVAQCFNSLSLRWIKASDAITTAGDFRSKVRLAAMGSDGIVKHDQWITGESAIQASDNPNKSGRYDDIPDRPQPGPTPGYDDDPWNGVSFSGVGVGGAGAFAKCYYMTSTELANLRSWMNSNNVPEGFDPMAQIIGLSQVPVSLSGDDNSTVQFVNSSAVYDPGVTRLVDSGVTTQIAMGTPIRYSLGSVDIARRMQERGEPYLDYDCQIELYLPLIGMFSLDTQAVMGRTITAEAVLDPISGTLAAYAYVSRDGQNLPIAYGSTTIGVDLPISSQQYSVSRAALKQANAQLGASILSSTLSFIAAATAGGKGSGTGAKTATGSTNGLAAAGIREAGADYMKASQAGNVFGDFMQWGRTIRQLSYGNNTAIAGSFGGSTAQWSYPFTPYVKIIRPRYEKPSNYAHSQGVPCVQTKRVGSCTGFIQCIGVDVSGITRATDLERQAIQAALANGVFAGGGS